MIFTRNTETIKIVYFVDKSEKVAKMVTIYNQKKINNKIYTYLKDWVRQLRLKLWRYLKNRISCADDRLILLLIFALIITNMQLTLIAYFTQDLAIIVIWLWISLTKWLIGVRTILINWVPLQIVFFSGFSYVKTLNETEFKF